MNKIYTIIISCCVTFFNVYANGQCTTNFLKNPSFELPVQTNLGNNFPVIVPNWNTVGGAPNLVYVNGSNYYGGPNTAANGSQYLDIVSATGTVEQTFISTCPSVFTFRGSFSSREVGRNWVAKIEIVNASNVVVATSAIRNFSTADADNNTPLGPDAVWYNLTGTSTTLPAGTYTFKAYLDDFGNFDNAFLCAAPGCLLPVKINDFKSINNDCNPTLQWKASSEYNLKAFEVEGSSDGVSFYKIGILNAMGGLGESSYSFTDNTENIATHFYRLKMLDVDGAYKYSSIVNVEKLCKGKLFSLSSNFIINELNINFYSATNTKTNYFINAIDGKLILTGKLTNGLTKINTLHFTKGLYTITAISSNLKQTLKFVKQ